jgi:NADP-dependent 3-hydroxy acid dehydrogenase YdfG
MTSVTSAETGSAARLLSTQVALVTGASSGIGRAVALALAGQGAGLCVGGRNAQALAGSVDAARALSENARGFRGDLAVLSNIKRLARFVGEEFGRLDILVHCAGCIHHGKMREASLRDLDRQYLANVRSVYALTQELLPLLLASRGQVVFINSSVGLTAKRADVGQFAATQHALRAIAESLREEVNSDGVRVLIVHPGRTATPRQALLHGKENKPYRPELLMQPEDIASMVVAAVTLPRTAEVTEIMMRPMMKS